jgi:glycosyltransferase involved in cell wall biosynthesis
LRYKLHLAYCLGMRSPCVPFDVVHVSSAHPWTDNRIHRREAASAAAAGYRTALVAVAEPTEQPDDDWSHPEQDTGVYVRRIPRRPRKARVLRSTVEAVGCALSSRAAVVHFHDPELVWAVPVLRALGRRVVYDAHEDLPDQVRSKPYLRPALRAAGVGLARVALAIARRADAVIAATPEIASRLHPTPTTIVRNFPRAVGEAVDEPTTRPLRAVYIGALSTDRGVGVLVRAAAAPDLPDGWVVTTAGRADADAERLLTASSRSDRGVEHRGVLHPVDAAELLRTARVGLLPLLPTPAYSRSIPTKLFEYMAAGLAVVATDIPAWRELLDGVDCVTWVPADDAAAVVAALRRYSDDPALLSRHAAAGRGAAHARFRWEHEERQLLAVYSELFTARPTYLAG